MVSSNLQSQLEYISQTYTATWLERNCVQQTLMEYIKNQLHVHSTVVYGQTQ